MAERQQSMHVGSSAGEMDRRQIADLLADLASQLDTVRQVFAATPVNALEPIGKSTPDVIFVDDLAHCMECSWGRHEGVSPPHMPADMVARCSQILESSLQLLKRVEQLQAVSVSRADTA